MKSSASVKLCTLILSLVFLPSSSAVSLRASAVGVIPTKEQLAAWRRGNLSLWRRIRHRGNHSKFPDDDDYDYDDYDGSDDSNSSEEEEPYEGTGCDAWCADEPFCDLPPCAKCKQCVAAAGDKFLEVGSISIGGWRPPVKEPQSFKFKEPFAKVPVVVLLATTRGPDPAAIRVMSVTKEGFKAVIAEPVGKDGPHAKMTVAFMAAVPGVHQLPDGRVVEAGTHQSKKRVSSWRCKAAAGPVQAWDKLTFKQAFPKPPALVTTIQTATNEVNSLPNKWSSPWLTVATKGLTAEGAQVGLEQAETAKVGTLTKEEGIGYIAMEAGVGRFSLSDSTDVKYAAVLSADIVRGWGNRYWKPITTSIPLGTDLKTPTPLVVGSQSRRDGGDGGWLRLHSASATEVKVTIDEDTYCDKERAHTTEQASIIAWSKAFTYSAHAS